MPNVRIAGASGTSQGSVRQLRLHTFAVPNLFSPSLSLGGSPSSLRRSTRNSLKEFHCRASGGWKLAEIHRDEVRMAKSWQENGCEPSGH